MSTPRINNWPETLALFIEEKKAHSFDWATNNCGFFACDWIAMVVGVDPAADFRDKIDSALSAQRVLDEVGGIESIATDAAFKFGWPPVAPAYARRGDIVSLDGGNGISLGVCLGAESVFLQKTGIAFFNTLQARRAWRIG